MEHYRIILAPEAVSDYQGLGSAYRPGLRDELRRVLEEEPRQVTDVTIADLAGIRGVRLRVGPVAARVFYDVIAETVEVLAIVFWLPSAGRTTFTVPAPIWSNVTITHLCRPVTLSGVHTEASSPPRPDHHFTDHLERAREQIRNGEATPLHALPD